MSLEKSIYLDHNASTPVREAVLEAIMPYFRDQYGNASSIHQLGQKTRKAIEDARQHVAEMVGADDPNEIIFTSGGTESNNMAIKGALVAHEQKGRRIVTSPIEHSAVRNVIRDLAETFGVDNVVVPVQPNGIMRVEDIDDAITPDTILVTVMAANNEVGTIQPVQEISKICKKKDVLLHTDAVQLAGKIQIRVNELGVDMLSISGHKFGAPKGVGALYVRKGTRLHGLIHGGRQEKNRRAGTENVPGIVGLGKAAELVKKDFPAEANRLAGLRDLFESLLMESVSHVSINGEKSMRTCNTSNLCIDYTENTAVLMALDLKGIQCSNGSACAAGSPDPSHVLLAMNLPQHKAHASLRFSLGHETSEDDIRKAVGIIAETVNRLRGTHPLWKEAVNG